MPDVIKSGSSGNTAEVDARGRLSTFAVSVPDSVQKTIDGFAYILTMPIVNLTTDNLSFVNFIKNNDTVPWTFIAILTKIGPSTDGGVNDLLQVVRINATEGTLITAGTPYAASNLNLAVATPLPATLLSGDEGSTVLNGFPTTDSLIVETPQRTFFEGTPISFPPGSSFSIGFIPPVGNTSMDVQISVSITRDIS